MPEKKILVVEDDEDIMELISYNLERENYTVVKAGSGEKALQKIAKDRPDMVLLDLMLPGTDGLQVCKKIKADPGTARIPVIMVTAKGEEADIITGLEAGADDYITKPFRPKELIARVRAVLRRGARDNGVDESGIVKINNIMIDPGRRLVTVKGKPVELTFTEFQILHVMAKRSGWVFTRYQIVDAVRGDDYSVTDRAVDVQIVGLRKKLGEAGSCIETVRGVGYRFRDSD